MIILWPLRSTSNNPGVVRLDPASGKTALIGSTKQRQNCGVRGGYLICMGEGNKLVATTLTGG